MLNDNPSKMIVEVRMISPGGQLALQDYLRLAKPALDVQQIGKEQGGFDAIGKFLQRSASLAFRMVDFACVPSRNSPLQYSR